MMIRNDFAASANTFTVSVPETVTKWLSGDDYQKALAKVLSSDDILFSNAVPNEHPVATWLLGHVGLPMQFENSAASQKLVGEEDLLPESKRFLKNYYVETRPYELKEAPVKHSASVEQVAPEKKPAKQAINYDMVNAGLFQMLKSIERSMLKSGGNKSGVSAAREAMYLLQSKSGKAGARKALEFLVLKNGESSLSKSSLNSVVKVLKPVLEKANKRVIAELKPHMAGRRGPETTYMKSQIADFTVYLRRVGYKGKGDSRSLITLARECWDDEGRKAAWDNAATATGDEHGYTSYKSLAARYSRGDFR